MTTMGRYHVWPLYTLLAGGLLLMSGLGTANAQKRVFSQEILFSSRNCSVSSSIWISRIPVSRKRMWCS